MSKVYLIEQPEPARTSGWMPDLTSVSRYGSIVPIFTRVDKPTLRPGPAYSKAIRTLEHYDVQDHILWVNGDPMGLFIVSSILSRKRITRVSYLRWERKRDSHGERNGEGFYIPVLVDLPQGENNG